MEKKNNVKSLRADSYKGKTNTEDRRALRAHRRSIEWKQMRDADVIKRRHLSNSISPVKEEVECKPKGKQELLKEKLARFREEKEKRKIEESKIKQRTFKVSKVEHKTGVVFQKSGTEPVGKKNVSGSSKFDTNHSRGIGSKTAAPVRRSTRSSTIIKQNTETTKKKPTNNNAATTSRTTRPIKPEPAKTIARQKPRTEPPKQTAHPKQKPGPPKQPARPVRATKVESSAPPTRSTRNSSRNKSGDNQPIQNGKKAPPSSKAKTTRRGPSPKKTAKQSVVTETLKQEERTIPTPASKKKSHIVKRSEVSFAPENFTFTAPANLQSYVFKPLSPASTNKFLFGGATSEISFISPPSTRRCSTPKMEIGANKVVHSPAGSVIPETGGSAEVDAKDKDSPNAEAPETTSTHGPVMCLEEQVNSASKGKSTRRSTRKSVSSSTETTEDASNASNDNKLEEEIDTVNVNGNEISKSTRQSLSTSRKVETPQPARTVSHKQTPDVPAPMEVSGSSRRPNYGQSKSMIEGGFRTPATIDKRRSTSFTTFLSSSKPKTPRQLRKLRNSLILRALSPEEGVEVLKHSPMVEIARRTPKPQSTGRQKVAPMEFDDDFPDPVAKLNMEAIHEDHHAEEHVPTPEPTKATSTPVTVETSPVIEETPKDTTQETNQSEPVSQETSQSEPVPSETSKSEHDVTYFRNMVTKETTQLNALSEKWEEKSKKNPNICEEAKDQVRTSIGKAQLLIARKGRLFQFSTLVDDCEFQRGEKETTCQDLQGFWDMVYFQVEDIYKMFEDLDKLEANDWKVNKPEPVKKIIKKKPLTKTVTSKPKAPAAKSKFAAFRAKMKQQQQTGIDICAPAVQATNNAATENKTDIQEPVKSDKENTKLISNELINVNVQESTPTEPNEPKEHINPCLPQPILAIARTEGLDVKTFEAGFFKINSPVASPKVHELCREGTPARSRRSSIRLSAPSSKETTPLRNKSPAHSPYAMAVLSMSIKKHRKSMGISPMENMESPVSNPLKRKSVVGVYSPLILDGSTPAAKKRRSTRGTTAYPTDGTPNTDGNPILAHTPGIAKSASIFTPDSLENKSLRRSTRKSERLSLWQNQSMDVESPSQNSDPMMKLLQPSASGERMEVESPVVSPLDVEMSAPARKSLKTTFDTTPKTPCVGEPKTPAEAKTPRSIGSRRLSASERRKSIRNTPDTRRRSRRSVHFHINTSPTEDVQPLHAPVTPYNRDSLVPSRRRTISGEQPQSPQLKPQGILTPVQAFTRQHIEPTSQSPATRFSKLSVNQTETPERISHRASKRVSQIPLIPEQQENEAPLIPGLDAPLIPGLDAPPSHLDTSTHQSRNRKSTRISLL